MTKLVQILLSKELVVNMGKDEHGQQKTVTLPAGVQEVKAEIAEHWFVKAHSQEITASDTANKELQDAYEKLKADHESLQNQSDAATSKIAELQKKIATLTTDLGLYEQRESEANKKLAEAEERTTLQSEQISSLMKQAKDDSKTISDLKKQIASNAKAVSEAESVPKA
ncbi:STY1053 family phage-associated protein [Acinetobacter radioresistens]|uniref:STY1053 family phage-associated protein n=1 Tax=Acinetobacter radioresistens TaxID=40216 RepID=UPI0011C3A9DD|nr:hypothetical protein [Acinetobacter radioresistens]